VERVLHHAHEVEQALEGVLRVVRLARDALLEVDDDGGVRLLDVFDRAADLGDLARVLAQVGERVGEEDEARRVDLCAREHHESALVVIEVKQEEGRGGRTEARLVPVDALEREPLERAVLDQRVERRRVARQVGQRLGDV